MDKEMATCHYCYKSLGCKCGSLRDEHYWSTVGLLRVCNECFPKISNDFLNMESDERLAALRLLHSNPWPTSIRIAYEIKPGEVVSLPLPQGVNLETIDATIEKAKGVLFPENVQKAVEEREKFFALHREGEYLAALEVGRALWNTANTMHVMMNNPDIKEGRKVRKQRRTAGFASGEERRAERKPIWDKWQAMADELKRKNPNLNKTAIAQRIANDCGVVRKTVSNKITLAK